MKTIFIFTALVLLLSLSAVSQTYTLNSSLNNQTITTCGGTLYDSGGPTGNYGNNENYTVTICSDNGGSITLNFTEFSTESVSFDYMTVYDANNNSVIIATSGGTSLQGQVFETNTNCVRIVWRTDGSVTYSGFAINLSCQFPCQDYTIGISTSPVNYTSPTDIYINTQLTFNAAGTYPSSGLNYTQTNSNLNWQWVITSPSGTTENRGGIGINSLLYNFNQEGTYIIDLTGVDINDCEVSERWIVNVIPVYIINNDLDNTVVYNCVGTIYDSGGISGNYSNNENREVTFCSNFPQSRPQLDFTSFNLAANDFISVYEGTGTSGSTLLPPTTGNVLPATIFTSPGEECLTIVFTSNGNGVATGFAIDISCIPPECQEFLLDSTSTTPALGNVINIRQQSTVDFEAFGNYFNNNISYAQADATTIWTWYVDGVEVYSGNETGANEFSYLFALEGMHQVRLVAKDQNPSSMCIAEVVWNVMVSPIVILNSSTTGSTISSCNMTLYDSGGPDGNYSNSENYEITICSDNDGYIVLDFTEFRTESVSFDYITVYNANNNSVIVAASGGTSLLGQTIETTTDCVRITWRSDGSSVYSGFEIDVSCKFDCQDFLVAMEGYELTDTSFIDVCQNTPFSLTATGTYPNNNENYFQSDSNVTWTWSIVSDEIDDEVSGIGMNTLNYEFPGPGGYFISLNAVDSNGCMTILCASRRVRVSLTPRFTGTTITDTVCPGELVTMTGSYDVNPWIYEYQEVIPRQTCIDGGQLHTEQRYTFTHSCFEPCARITSAYDIQSIILTLEHSYIGDLDIFLECPNGQRMSIISYPNGCTNAWFGEAIDNDGRPCEIGVAYPYTWSPTATTSFTSVARNYTGNRPVPSGTYLPTGNFSDLIGCPINGDWSVIFVDNLNSDDGTITQVEFYFADHLVQSAANCGEWTYTNTYENFTWSGENIASNGITATARPNTSGDISYLFTITDDFGCSHDTTITVHVRPTIDPICCVTPVAYAGDDEQVCGYTHTLNAQLLPGNTGSWQVVESSVPSGARVPTFANPNSPNATVTVYEEGIYQFEWTEMNISPACMDSDTVTIEFRTIPTSTFSYTPILCYGESTTVTYTGNVGANATFNWNFSNGIIESGSGIGPYRVRWANAGIYNISLQVNYHYCSSTETISNLDVPSLLSFNVITTDDPCFQSCGGIAELVIQGGRLPYAYSWTSPTNVLDNLCANDYTVTVTDNNGCTASKPFSISEPNELVITASSSTNLSCYNSFDGDISITVAGGTGNISYIWSDIGAGMSERAGLAAGNYQVTAIDANGCSVSEQFTLTQPTQLSVTISPDIAICETTQAVIQAQAMGGTPQYTYYWDMSNGSGFAPNNSTLILTPDTTTRYFV
ncbi:MAG: hypothetical protein LBQ22_08390, partial [Bacteroidales bacterium]|nr:hypothetical protein [Bacteroidales bacterium]